MAQIKPQDDYMKTALRLPRELHARIQQAAADSERSMNSEIVTRLERSFQSQVNPFRDMAAKLRDAIAPIPEDTPPGKLPEFEKAFLHMVIEMLATRTAEMLADVPPEQTLGTPEERAERVRRLMRDKDKE